MSIKSLWRLLLAALLIVLIALLGVLGKLWSNQAEITVADQRQFSSLLLADELRQSSDDLTRMARLYVMTGKERYRNWFDEVLAIRQGATDRPTRYHLVYWDLVLDDDERPRPAETAISLENLMVEQGFTVDEFSLIEEAREKSDDLARIETVAMNALVGRYDDGTGTFQIEGDPDKERARELMFSDEYMATKASIMEPINRFMIRIEERTASEVAELRAEGSTLGFLAIGLGVLSVLIVALAQILLGRKVLKPLAKVERSVDAVTGGRYDEPIDHSSSDEFGSLAHAFNNMLSRLGTTLRDLELANEKLVKRGDALQEEKNRADELLLNVLPSAIAERLREGETTIADEFPEVTVYFSDIAGFTLLSERVGHREIVRILNEIFALMDEKLDGYEIEKIKTIGDAYMAVSGAPEPVVDHAHQIAAFALEVQDALNEYALTTGLDLKIRAGIHSGSAIAGVVGTKRFVYDMWGDVVNVASRMESTGTAGKIQISESTMVRLKDRFEIEEVGVIEVKGKGRMRTFHLGPPRYQSGAG
ncbi:MAG: adenylate/guanylate cyclase domain-containing protein [Pseudomonadota bacterium]